LRTIVKGRNIDVPDRVRQYAERKMSRLERVTDDSTDAVVEFSAEQHHSTADSQIVEVTLVVAGQVLRGHASGPTHQAALDLVIDRIERQAVEAHEKPRETRTRARPTERAVSGEAAEAPDGEGGEPIPAGSRIVKTKRFDIEPMFEEDALARMEELGHHFFIFVNAENERLSVLYKRRAGDYGLIEPVIGGEYMPGRNVHRAG
jgi:putative sigma-54 modulation protein